MKFQKKYNINSIEDAARAFRDHEGISIKNVRAWSEQFGSGHQNLALKILKNIDYYSGSRIRQLVERLVELVCEQLQLNNVKSILFIPIGNPYEGSSVVARALRDVAGIEREQIKYLSDLANVPERSSIRAIVLLDDFSGSGDRFIDWWRNVEALLLPWDQRSVQLILGILLLNCRAKETLKSIPAEKLYVAYLDKRCNVFSKKSKIFFKREKILIENFCKKTGCGSEYLRGYKDCGLLLAFKHGCPNNSIPVLWYQSRRWKRLFRRRAI